MNQQYTVTYIQEVTHTMEGPDTKWVGDQAQEYAKHHSLRLLSVVRKVAPVPVHDGN